MLEVCVDSLESALNAIHGGADELEVCSSLAEGGLTPTAGLVRQILSAIIKVGAGSNLHKTCPEACDCKDINQKPKVNVMIRCRTGSDFCYTIQEMDTMLADVEIFKGMNVDRFVFGALNNKQEVDIENCVKIASAVAPTPMTFHRAFDVAEDPVISVRKIVKLGFSRLLTSGQRTSADDPKGIKCIKNLQDLFGDRIEIMPGAGVNVKNAKKFIDLGCKIIHSSCKINRILPKMENNLSMGTGDSECLYITDKDVVKHMKEVLKL